MTATENTTNTVLSSCKPGHLYRITLKQPPLVMVVAKKIFVCSLKPTKLLAHKNKKEWFESQWESKVLFASVVSPPPCEVTEYESPPFVFLGSVLHDVSFVFPNELKRISVVLVPHLSKLKPFLLFDSDISHSRFGSDFKMNVDIRELVPGAGPREE